MRPDTGRLLLAVSVTTRLRQEADSRFDGLARLGQVAATLGETRSRATATARGRQGSYAETHRTFGAQTLDRSR